jgi:hypothetical protein
VCNKSAFSIKCPLLVKVIELANHSSYIIYLIWICGFVEFLLLVKSKLTFRRRERKRDCCLLADAKQAPVKKKSHRALEDIKESIAELRYMQKTIFKSSRRLKLDQVG